MKLGIVGTGTIVEEVLPVLQQVKGLSCYGICGTKRSEAKAEKLKEQYQMIMKSFWIRKLIPSTSLCQIFYILKWQKKQFFVENMLL